MVAILKYVICDNKKPILFGKEIMHNSIGVDAISAGFLTINYDSIHKKIKVKCFGESSTLNISSNPITDKEIIETLLNGV